MHRGACKEITYESRECSRTAGCLVTQCSSNGGISHEKKKKENGRAWQENNPGWRSIQPARDGNGYRQREESGGEYSSASVTGMKRQLSLDA